MANYFRPLEFDTFGLVRLGDLQRYCVDMKRVLITGMSGTGKSSVIEALRADGEDAVDLDTPEWSHWIDAPDTPSPYGPPVAAGRDWVWREDRVAELLEHTRTKDLFVSGCAENMKLFYPRFDAVVLLSAPVDVVLQRLKTRTNNPYGQSAEERDRVLNLIAVVEPLLRKKADVEIDTSRTLDEVVAEVLRIAKD